MSEEKENIYTNMVDDINSSDLDDSVKRKILENIHKSKNTKTNLMITGATGCGKSSTINAMFKTDTAKVGVGSDPETMEIKKYTLDNLILWDSPGLGDGKEKDIQHSKGIIAKLNELDENNKPLIDLVLVILDGGSRDLGTSYELINSVIIPNIGEDAKDRILIAINQADAAMKGRNWDYKNNKPEPKLVEFLEDKVQSVKKRIKEGTGVNIEPIYYSAGFKEGDEAQRPYNLSKLLYFIVTNTPADKRLAYVDTTSKDKEMWEDDDEILDYGEETRKSLMESVIETAKAGGAIGEAIGAAFGPKGKVIGKAIGTFIGGVCGAISSVFSS